MTALPLLTTPSAVQAQGLIDFLWGGSQEWGGDRQVIKFDPKYTPGQIIVSFGDRRLYLLTKPGEAVSYPIAVPREKSRWQGTTKITSKKENPSWRPTAEMLAENPKLPHWVPGGHPMNPLGVRALYLGTSAYRIHGTDAPWTIGKAVSQGCIRMNNKDVLNLFPRVPVGTRVTVTWERFTTDAAVAYNSDEPPYQPGNQPEPATFQEASSDSSTPPLPRKAPALAEKATASHASNDGLPQDFIALDDSGHPLPHASAAHKVKHAEATPAKAAKKEAAKQAEAPKKSEGPKVAETTKRSEPEKKPATAQAAEPAKQQEIAKVSEPKVAPPKAPEPSVAKPAKFEEPVSASVAPSADDATASAVASARRAAEAAARAAEMARAAAEAAKKAAADAKKATSASNVPEAAPGKAASGTSASL